MTREDAIAFISQFSVYQYAFLKAEDAEVSDSVVKGCRNCRNYRTSWSCPPAIVRFEKCRRELASYEELLIFSTIFDRRNDADGSRRRACQKEQEKITNFTAEFFKTEGYETYILTSDRCSICDKCSFPHKACRHPDRMHPCIESHGIKMSDLLDKCEMDCFFDDAFSLLFTLIFFRKKTEYPDGGNGNTNA